MEVACRRTAEHLRFWAPHISHAVAVLVLGPSFYSKDPESVGDAINIFLFPELPPLAIYEAALLARMWDAIIGGGTLKYFADTILLIAKQRVKPVTS